MANLSNSNHHNLRAFTRIIQDFNAGDLEEIVTLANELRTDHATFKAAQDSTETLIEELHDDHASFKAVVDDLKTLANGLRLYVADQMLAIGTLAISATAEKFKTTTTAIYRIGGTHYTKAATDNLAFSAAYTVNTGAAAGQFWGAFLVQINAAGTVSTKAVAADQVYASEAAAIAALPAADASNVRIGYITVQTKDTDAWVANTDDLTAGSDCAAANFYDLPAPATLPSAVATSAPATLTAAKPSSAPATITAAAIVKGD